MRPFNPYAPYKAEYLPLFRRKGVRAFIRQTLQRGRDPMATEGRPSFLISHYTEAHMAVNHLDALAHDPGRKMFLTDNPEHLREMMKWGTDDCTDDLFVSLRIPDAEKKARKMLHKQLHAYIDLRLNWKVPGYDSVNFSLEFIFGEIYAVLSHAGKFHKVKIEDIETMRGYVL